MYKLPVLALVTVLFAGACSSNPASRPTAETTTDPSGKASSSGTLSLGIDVANMDPGVRPQDDFYRHVNGKWLASTTIPADKSNYGSFTELFDVSERQQKEIIDHAAQSAGPAGSDAKRIGKFYRAFMNEEAVEAAGATPLRPWLAQVHAVSDKSQLMDYFGQAQRFGFGSPLAFWVNQDAGNTTEYIAYLSQSGLSLPDRDYYLQDTEKFLDAREKFVAHIERVFAMAGLSKGREAAANILALETRLAAAQWDRVRNRDRNATYNRLSKERLTSHNSDLNMQAFLNGAGIGAENYFVVRQPDYLTALGKIVAETPLSVWRQYLNWQVIDQAAPYLSKNFVDADFDFFSRTLRGVEENRPRWKRGVAAVNATLGEAVGKLYVEKYFAPESKARMDQMIDNLRAAFAASIDTLEWMSADTKVQAQKKLAKFTPKIAYPDKWKDYSGLQLTEDNLVANMLASAELEYERMLNKLGGPIDRTEWFMTPQTVNAYYNPSMNEIVFPAAILRPPFFNVEADDAVNYGGIGAVIGHEFSHGFDDQGRKSDGDGTLRDWWTEQDAQEFKRRADGLVAQYAAFSPVDGLHVNGELTLGENIGDLAGLTMAYRAYRLSLNGKEAPVINGYSGDQRFFMGWAQVWRRLYREDELRRRLLTDPHSPSEYRVNGIVANMPEFYAAFNVMPGDRLFRPAQERVKIW
ncbi:MAG: hypothetical protein HKN70_02645 [Gammaproteobacteria bacterium]|nr:hypothetical protein [Gammaproteobacteria bacterium]